MAGTVGTTSMESSEGLHIEYIAIFLAVLFPGALVAFNYELLQSLPRFTALRIYCAGIWHNAVCCVVCGLALFLLPLILYPLYIHGESPMVLDVSPTSPLTGYLSPGDVIVSLDGLRIHEHREWTKIISLMDEQTVQNSNYSKDFRGFPAVGFRRGYCVPKSLMEDNKKIHPVDDQFACPNELTAFVIVPCFSSSMLDDGSSEDSHQNNREGKHCLSFKDVVELKKCGDGWATTATSRSICVCSEDESCLTPVQVPGLTWVEITYSSPHSSECLQFGRNSSADFKSDSGKTNCGGTFVFVGDVLSMEHSVRLTAYRSRWPFIFGAYLPNIIEKMLACTFQVSLTLALLNSLPVYFLDGESILEVSLCYITLLSHRKRGKVLQICLFGGTLLSILAFSRIFLSIFL
ncbi:hypothetical protein HHK36_023121 [Tetracentron sinense]|uniref:Endopeptidase S2P n=1 Tax=Tetracentron sinense TaxID=13715 RepID=A0A834YLZ9_TETSI|nr:hypothetical protein HHK36_023121 [Tetracentron sinense]